ncbi:MAG: Wzy polymerase domain-containing protein [Ideonella sp.]|nr:Wzy polymerase domain-containing protein [Ideonella sp.]
MTTASTRPPPLPATIAILVIAAVCLPMLLAWTVPPSATFHNQAAALILWGLAVVLLARWLPPRDLIYRAGLNLLLGALTVVGLAALLAPSWAALPWGLALSGAGVVAAAGVAAAAGAAVSQARRTADLFAPLAAGVLVAGAGSAAVAAVQVFAPGMADGTLIATGHGPGRAAGNLRQANQLATLMLWAIVAAVWWADRAWRRAVHERAFAPTRVEAPGEAARRAPPAREGFGKALRIEVALALALVVALGTLVLTGSRTGLVGVFVLAAWGALDRRLPRPLRWILALAPLAYGGLAWAHHAWAAAAAIPGAGLARPHVDVTSYRVAVWANTLQLIALHPWAGVGFGQFNFAWTLTPFVERPPLFFDHAHNLPLHLMAELGVPLGLLVIGLLAVALWKGFRAAFGVDGEPGAALRAAFMMVLLVGVHSQFEYPLWYAYFLLPAAFLWGLMLAGHEKRSALDRALFEHRPVRTMLMAAGMGSALTVAAVWDYHRVSVIFAPPPAAGPLAERIAEGRRSWFFAHHADYAAITTAERPSALMPAFDRAAHHLLDARLLMAWARAMDETNQTDRARHLAQRLAEFRHPQAAEFFAVCARYTPEEIATASEPPRPLPRPVAALGAADTAGPAARPADAPPAPTRPTDAAPAVPGDRPATASGPGLARDAVAASEPMAPPGMAGPAPTAAASAPVVAASATPVVVPPAQLPRGPAPPPDPAFTPPPPVAVPFQCLRPVRALTFEDFR